MRNVKVLRGYIIRSYPGMFLMTQTLVTITIYPLAEKSKVEHILSNAMKKP